MIFGRLTVSLLRYFRKTTTLVIPGVMPVTEENEAQVT